MDSERAVPVIRFVNDQRKVGSGYRINGHFVLTAAHCVTGSGHRIWLADGERLARVVADGGRSLDLALLEILFPELGQARLRSLRWSRHRAPG